MSGLNQLKITCSFGMVEVELKHKDDKTHIKYGDWIEAKVGLVTYKYSFGSFRTVAEISKFCEDLFKVRNITAHKVVLNTKSYQVIASELIANQTAKAMEQAFTGELVNPVSSANSCTCSMRDLLSHGHVMGCTFEK